MKLGEILTAVKQAITNMDLYGQVPTFRMLGKQKYTTSIGLFFTVVTILITLVYFVSGIQIMIFREYPTIIQTDRQLVETSQFHLLPSNFTLAVSVADQNQQALSTLNTYFTISIVNCAFYRSKNATTGTITIEQKCQTYPTEPCGPKHFVTEVQKDFFSNIKLGAVQCLNKDAWDAKPPILQGVKQAVNYSQLTITFAACQNTTEKQDCAPPEQISSQLKSGYYVVYLSNSLLQFMKPGNMSEEIIQLEYTSFSISTSKAIYQGFKVIQTYTDEGTIFKDISQTQHLIQHSYRESSDLYNSNFLVQHNIILDNIYSQYERSYDKIWVILSRVGGLYQMICILIAALIKPIIQVLMKIEMSNEIFLFETKKTNNDMDKVNIEAVDAMTGIIRSSKFQKETNSNNQNGNLLKSIWEKKHRRIRTSCKQVFLIICRCDSVSRKQLTQAETLFMERIDVANIIQKLHEIDKLKYILLTKDQRNLFDCLPKPVIKNNEDDFECSVSKYSYIQKNLYKDDRAALLQMAFDSFKNVITQNQLNYIDRAILRSMDEQVKSIFQQVYFELNSKQERKDCSILCQGSPSNFPSKSQINLEDFIMEEESDEISKEGSPQQISIRRQYLRKLQ